MRRLIVVALTVVVAACGGPSLTPAAGSPSPSAPVTIASHPSIQPPISPSPGPRDWSALEWAKPVSKAPYETISDTVAWGGGYIAVGGFQNAKGGSQAAAWLSVDWRTWTRTLLDFPRAGDSSLRWVVATRSRLVGIGTSGVLHCIPPSGEGEVCDPLPIALWTSPDGRSWQRIATPASFKGVTIADVASTPTGVALVGDSGWDEPGIWTSADGATWNRQVLSPSVFAKAHFRGIAVTDRGWVVDGSSGGARPVCCDGGGGDSAPAAWFSPDGVNWRVATLENPPAAVREAPAEHVGAALDSHLPLDRVRMASITTPISTTLGSMDRIFVGRSGFLVAGGATYGWTSLDGRTWRPLQYPEGGMVTPLGADGDRIIGESYVAGDQVAYWLSTDGATWSPLAASGASDQMPRWGAPASANAAYPFPTGVGFVGQDGSASEVLWFALGAPEPSPTSTPTETPTPTVASDVPLCQTDSLAIKGGRDGETGVVHIGVLITNTGSRPCALPGLPATVELLRASGKPLDLAVDPPLGNVNDRVLVRPGVPDDAWLIFYWMNWCEPSPGPLQIRITFHGAAGAVVGPDVGPLLPRCDAPGRGSRIQVDSIGSSGN